MTKTYRVTTVPWEEGWELHIADEGVTQCGSLDDAAKQVRDYLGSLHDRDFDDARIELVVTFEPRGIPA